MTEATQIQFVRVFSELSDSDFIVRKQGLLQKLAAVRNGFFSKDEEATLLQELELLDIEMETRKNKPTQAPTIEATRLEVEEEVYEKTVIKRLKEYKTAKQSQVAIVEAIENLRRNMTPSEQKITASYDGMPGGSGGRSSKVEDAVLRPFDLLNEYQTMYYKNEKKIYQMERALEQLSELEYKVIFHLFLTTDKVKVSAVYMDLKMGKTTFYVYRRQAINILAKSLKLI